MSDWPAEAGRIPTDATTADFVTAVYSSKVINHVRSNLIAVSVCNTSWRSELAKGNMVYIPVMSTYTASDVDVTTSLVTTQAAVTNAAWGETPESITIAYWKECPVMIDDSTALQTNVSGLLDIAAGNAAYALEKAIDTTVNTLFASLTNTWMGSDGQTFSDDILINLMEGLDEADVPRPDRALIVDPSCVADIYKIDKFMTYDYSKTVFTTDGYIGKVNTYNLPLFVTNNLYATGGMTGAWGALLHRDAIGVVIQSDPKVEKWREPTLHSDVVNISAIYGADIVRSTFGARFYTRKK